ncbi:hypothetical protein BCR37DRAFT_390941 [Protomyces lactucae-debilis]|uniref:Uncharacterized protein n=1 Tax=Protomyces lactucae-debilis TaxID=2754530 RepID=A0A1Y2FS70_PROLT|nr:uncharacterized protein BCR37DRAFT_390941 [Protomyces lactucae-debilis]ORY86144.1 hypothetical protein BCR37DRAFT_390941 [Protomyces lactucae-debilis]
MSATSHVGEHKKTYLFGTVAAVVCLVVLGGRTGGVSQASLANSNDGRYCKWIFDRYESSFYETEWFNLVSNGGVNDNVCSVIREPRHASMVADIITRLSDLVGNLDSSIRWFEQDTAKTTTEHASDGLFSRFHYRRVCFNENDGAWYKAPGRGVQLIEPLFGMLRDPYDAWCGGELELPTVPDNYENEMTFESTQHLLPQGYAPYAFSLEDGDSALSWRPHGRPPWHSNHHPVEIPNARYSYSPPRNMLIDLGADAFKKSLNAGIWFNKHYHDRGQPFESILVATSDEPTKYPDLRAAYDGIPEELIGIYNVIGVPVTLENDRTNVVDLLRRTVRPNDNVVLRLHGFARGFSKAFIQKLAKWDDDPLRGGLSGLVDELYFEHKVNFMPMAKIWGFGGGEDPLEAGSLASSYKLFMDLRNHGIRAHSWP